MKRLLVRDEHHRRGPANGEMITVISLIPSGSDYDYIELHRTFHELPQHSDQGDDANLDYQLGVGERLRWSDLVREYRLVILAEAGAGKTTEARHIARDLRGHGRHAYLLRLEYVSDHFEDAFEEGTYSDFCTWLQSGEEGWFFLDSVDEARLRNPGDFELAIRKMSRLINVAMDRAHIVITSRTTAWRSKTDLDFCDTRLSYAGATTSTRSPLAEGADADGSLRAETRTHAEPQAVFKVVALDDLTRDQVAAFARARGLPESKGFLDAIERTDAWSFASRPQDLEELFEFWTDKGQIGSRLEIMQNSISLRLAESDRNRAEARPLSQERAREGARLLAAATTLAQNSAIRVPDGTRNREGITVQSVLPDWDDKDQLTLLSRSIFDEAIYGTVRFHHRSVREYLTAEWFSELLQREASRSAIEALFIRDQYGLDVIVPTLRPILAWLVIFDPGIRDRTFRIAPEAILEGGDPSQLPLELRRQLLHQVCAQIADGTAGRSVLNYDSVQRLAGADLTDDIRDLIRRCMGNDDLTVFLLGMVWVGQLKGALPEAMDVALSSTAGSHSRTVALRAIKVIGSREDQERVRRHFMEEVPGLKRQWLAELLDGVQPSNQILEWLLACLEKSERKKGYTGDRLVDRVTEFAAAAAIDLLPRLVTGLNKLLTLPPMIECRYCEVSERHRWLMVPACKAVERLILARHPATFSRDTLAVLRKYEDMRDHQLLEATEVKTELSELVPEWEDLNRALFWFDVARDRGAVDGKREERLIDYWRVQAFGRLWRFTDGDFEYAAGQACRQALLDDRLVALSLAFDLYRSAGRPRSWRLRLKKLVAEDDELSRRLAAYLKPPARGPDSIRSKRRRYERKRRAQASCRRQEEYHASWKRRLSDGLEDARAESFSKPGTITDSVWYLFWRTRDRGEGSERWTKYNWRTLIREYGEEVARFYRDAAVRFWRHYRPVLRSEGAPANKTTCETIVGLTGLEIEANETKDWPRDLSDSEVELACRYASHELNGFPTWFPRLFQAYPRQVSDFLLQEIHYELSTEKLDAEAHYVLSDVSWAGQWAWDQMAPSICKLLKSAEPRNLANLDNLLNILQGSALSNDQIRALAARKCRTLRKPDHIARWFAVWTGVAPSDAIPSLVARLRRIPDHREQTHLAIVFVTHLCGSRSGDGATARQMFRTPEHLKSLYLLMHRYIHHEDDIRRNGTSVYTPGLRDAAQSARNRLLEWLSRIPGKESFLALMDIAELHPDVALRPWIRLYAKERAERDADLGPWSASEVRDFHERLERTPNNHRELAELAVLRLTDLRDELESGDFSISSILRCVRSETKMRNYIASELRKKAHGRYTVSPEEEFADAKRPDLRLHGMGFDGPVPVELKIADNWSGHDLFDRLETQLCGDYLRDIRSRRGIFLLFHRGEKSRWGVPGVPSRVHFSELVAALQEHWHRISPKITGVDDIKVIGIDLTKRSS